MWNRVTLEADPWAVACAVILGVFFAVVFLAVVLRRNPLLREQREPSVSVRPQKTHAPPAPEENEVGLLGHGP